MNAIGTDLRLSAGLMPRHGRCPGKATGFSRLIRTRWRCRPISRTIRPKDGRAPRPKARLFISTMRAHSRRAWLLAMSIS